MIEVKNLIKSFPDKDVLKNISAKFETAKANLIIGRSGAGKTVLLKCMIGLMQPTSGSILYDGRDLTKMSKHELLQLRSELGMLFQGSALFDSMSVLENVLFPMDMFSNASKAERIDKAEGLLERVGLIDAKKKFPSEISGGMMKRAAIARALALDPKYLFCDEPNSGLDPKTSLTIDELIYGLTKELGITTVINTHDMNSVRNIGDHIIFIRKGIKEWEGTNKEISEGPETLQHFINATLNL
ncbi:ABC transporter ATP-binding protein [Falsiporphyromonas endometrii]|uniref:ABC transporter ATP-binding protein n=1 Tax=Falsiporphyromonas endometrii TaxID=1387297 RepID=A0ABV9K9D0_9PORP